MATDRTDFKMAGDPHTTPISGPSRPGTDRTPKIASETYERMTTETGSVSGTSFSMTEGASGDRIMTTKETHGLSHTVTPPSTRTPFHCRKGK